MVGGALVEKEARRGRSHDEERECQRLRRIMICLFLFCTNDLFLSLSLNYKEQMMIFSLQSDDDDDDKFQLLMTSLREVVTEV